MSGEKNERPSKRLLIEVKRPKHTIAAGQTEYEKCVTQYLHTADLNVADWEKRIVTHVDRDHIMPHNINRHLFSSAHSRDFDVDLVVYMDDLVLKVPAEVSVAPPALGERILRYLCTPAELEGVLGDLEETFRKIVAKDGRGAAQRWYWWQVARSGAAFGMKLLSAAVVVKEMLSKLGL
jgi:hypothetical protein